jgi:hypothetical protein
MPFLVIVTAGVVGLCLMVGGFVLVARHGSWVQAMRSKPNGQWSLARSLMFSGACLSAVTCFGIVILFVIPGGIPWNQGSDWSGVMAALPGLAAVWYFIVRPAIAARRRQRETHSSLSK